MMGTHDPDSDRHDDRYGPQPVVHDQNVEPATAEQHMRDLAAVMPGAFYRFRYTPEGEYRLDFVSQGVSALNELSRVFDLSDFNKWVELMPGEYVEPFIASIEHSRHEMSTWAHEWPMDAPSGRIWLQGISEPHREDDGGIVWNGLLLDITARKQATAKLSRVETDYRSVFENTTEGIYRSSRDGRLLEANQMLIQMHGCTSKTELINTVNNVARDWYVHPEDRRSFLAEMDRHGSVEGFQAEIYRIGTGERIWTQENARAIHDDTGNLLYYQGTVRDITAEQRTHRLAEARNELLEHIARNISLDKILREIIAAIEVYRPGAAAAILSLGGEGLISVKAAPGLPQSCIELLDGAAPDGFGGAITAAMETNALCLQSEQRQPASDSVRLTSALDDAGFDETAVTSVRDAHDTVLGFLVTLTGSSAEVDADLRQVLHEMAQIIAIALERDRLIRHLVEAAQHDGVTGLPNRLLLADRMRQAMLDADRNGLTVGILLLDLDRFKHVNDTLGHDAGDTLLKEITRHLLACVRATDTVTRFGGDEFVIVVSLDEPDRTKELAERIVAALAKPVVINGAEVFVPASIGISLYPNHARTADKLIQAADIAMYAVKNRGGNQYRLFDTSMTRE